MASKAASATAVAAKHAQRREASQRLLQLLKTGPLMVGKESPPIEVEAVLGMSKRQFNLTLSSLVKRYDLDISEYSVRFLGKKTKAPAPPKLPSSLRQPAVPHYISEEHLQQAREAYGLINTHNARRNLLPHTPPAGAKLPPNYGRSGRYRKDAEGSIWVEKSPVQEVAEAAGLASAGSSAGDMEEEEDEWKGVPTFDDDTADIDLNTYLPVNRRVVEAQKAAARTAEERRLERKRDKAGKRRNRRRPRHSSAFDDETEPLE